MIWLIFLGKTLLLNTVANPSVSERKHELIPNLTSKFSLWAFSFSALDQIYHFQLSVSTMILKQFSTIKNKPSEETIEISPYILTELWWTFIFKLTKVLKKITIDHNYGWATWVDALVLQIVQFGPPKPQHKYFSNFQCLTINILWHFPMWKYYFFQIHQAIHNNSWPDVMGEIVLKPQLKS